MIDWKALSILSEWKSWNRKTLKKRLMEEAKRHKDALTGDKPGRVWSNTENYYQCTLLIGGALALTYVLVRQFSGGKSKRKKPKP